MNILVTGANGQLGMCLREESRASSHSFIFTDINEVLGLDTVYLDITNPGAIDIIAKAEKIDVIVNCAAYTDVDKAEGDVDFASVMNSQAPANLSAVALKYNATLVHISTDYVFPGEGNIPIKESKRPDPRSVYGSTKLSGEIAIRNSGCKSIILRTAWMYSPYGKNFVKKIGELTREKPSIKVVYDQVGSPTYAGDLAKAIVHILDSGQVGKTGVYHFVGSGAVSWYDFACEIRSLLGTKGEIEPCLSEEFESRVQRPHYSVLDTTLFRKTFSFSIPYWRDSLEKCISKL